VFRNKVLRWIFGTKRQEITGGWRGLLNEKVHSSYPSPNIVRVIKSKRTGKWNI